MEGLLRDVRFSLRSLRRQPAFASGSILILALAIGGATAVFSLMDSVLLRDLPYRQPRNLVTITHETPSANSTSLPLPLLHAFLREARTLTDVSEYHQKIKRVILTGSAEPEEALAVYASSQLFRLLGIAPLHGRWFTREEENRQERVVVMSYQMWQRRFAGAPDVVGRTVEVDGASWSIIGVMPRSFEFPNGAVGLWIPLERADAAGHWRYSWVGIGRLDPGVTPAAAEEELNRIVQAGGFPTRVDRVRVNQFDSGVAPVRRIALWLLLGAVGAVLLIACLNLGALLLSQGESRQPEFKLRASIGAGRARLIRQLFTESLVVAALGGFAGTLLASWAIRLIQVTAPPDLPRLLEVSLDARALLFLTGTTSLAAILFGIVPAFRVTGGLCEIGRSTPERESHRWRAALVVGQFATAVALLVAAGLLIRSFVAVGGLGLGFERDNLFVVQARLRPDARPRAVQYYEDVLSRLKSTQGVAAAGAINDLFELGAPRSSALRTIDGLAAPQTLLPLKWTQVGGDFFQAIGARLLGGRYFGERDTANSERVVIVDETFARRFFPGIQATGHRIKGQEMRGRHDESLTIIGVVADMRREGLEKDSTAHVFEWDLQAANLTPYLLVRTRGASAAAIRSTIREVDRTALLSEVSSMEAEVDRFLQGRRFQMALFSIFSGVALLLASLGVFGVLHYAVARRTREIGVRMAMGATAQEIVWQFLRFGLKLAAVGGSLGMAMAYIASHAISSLLFGVTPNDPATYSMAAAALLATTLLASLAPSLRAARLDPIRALREE